MMSKEQSSQINERIATLQRLQNNKQELSLSLGEVRAIDAYLADEWGIKLPAPDWEESLSQSLEPGLYQRYRYLHERQARYKLRRRAIPADLEERWYDLLANKQLAGLVHSQKRTWILDAAALVQVLLERLKIRGSILDVGCNIGYHAIWLARHHANQFVGIDTSKASIETANESAGSSPNLRFNICDACEYECTEQFEMVYAVDSLPDDGDRTIARISSWLAPGGIFVVVDDAPPKISFARFELGMHFVDVTGGYLGCENGFEAKYAVVFIKGSDDSSRDELLAGAKSAWPYFRPYANTPGVPPGEKTQAYHRAKCREGQFEWVSDFKPA